MEQYIGVDLGGTNIRIARADKEGNILASEAYATFDFQGSFQDYFISSILKQLTGDVRSVGIGIPGICHEGCISAAPNIPAFDAAQMIAQFNTLGIALQFRNDVGCAALGEMWRGAAKGVRDFLYVNLGTGLSLAVVLGGQPQQGHHSAAGEIAYWVTDPNSNIGYADDHAPLEEIFSGRWIAENLNKSLKPTIPYTTKRVFEAYAQGDKAIRQAVDNALKPMVNALANCCILLDPELLVFGGGMADALPLFEGPMQARFKKIIPNPPRVTKTALQGKAGLYGAIKLAIDGHANPNP